MTVAKTKRFKWQLIQELLEGLPKAHHYFLVYCVDSQPTFKVKGLETATEKAKATKGRLKRLTVFTWDASTATEAGLANPSPASASPVAPTVEQRGAEHQDDEGLEATLPQGPQGPTMRLGKRKEQLGSPSGRRVKK